MRDFFLRRLVRRHIIGFLSRDLIQLLLRRLRLVAHLLQRLFQLRILRLRDIVRICLQFSINAHQSVAYHFLFIHHERLLLQKSHELLFVLFRRLGRLLKILLYLRIRRLLRVRGKFRVAGLASADQMTEILHIQF